jgi:hypothetical protein
MYHNKCINQAPILYHQPCTNHVHQSCTCTSNCTITMCQPCTSTINTCTIPCANHAHQPRTKPPAKCQYHQDVPQALCQHQVSNMRLNHVPKKEPIYASTSIIPTSTRHASIHVPQPYTISIMICLNHAIHHTIINM